MPEETFTNGLIVLTLILSLLLLIKKTLSANTICKTEERYKTRQTKANWMAGWNERRAKRQQKTSEKTTWKAKRNETKRCPNQSPKFPIALQPRLYIQYLWFLRLWEGDRPLVSTRLSNDIFFFVFMDKLERCSVLLGTDLQTGIYVALQTDWHQRYHHLHSADLEVSWLYDCDCFKFPALAACIHTDRLPPSLNAFAISTFIFHIFVSGRGFLAVKLKISFLTSHLFIWRAHISF